MPLEWFLSIGRTGILAIEEEIFDETLLIKVPTIWVAYRDF
jgi:hypothetical protein